MGRTNFEASKKQRNFRMQAHEAQEKENKAIK